MVDEKLTNEFLAIASPLIDAAFDTLSLLVDREFKTASGTVSSPSNDEIDKLVSDHAIAVRVPLSQEATQTELCILMDMGAATTIADLVGGGEGSASKELTEESEKTLQTSLDQMIAAAETGIKNAVGESFSLGAPALANLAADSDALSALKSGAVASAEFTITCDTVLDSQVLVMMPTDTLAKLSTETASADADATPEESRPATAPAAAPSRGVASDIENIDLILDVQLSVVARLGQVEMPISEVLALGPGAIIEVGRSVEEPVELFVNEKLIARGEVVVVDEKFGLRITEIVSPSDRVKSLR
jgi:flagellar motor switch protein FliN/FliY